MSSKGKNASHFGMVNIADLNIDPQVQRKLSPPWVKAHTADFDVDLLGYIVVNRRADGKLYVVDGQHRTELMRKVGWGDQKIHAEIFDDLDLTEEARLFLARNDRRAVRAFDTFRIAVVAGEPVPCDIVRIVKSAGLVLSDAASDGHIAAVAALERVYNGAGIASPQEGAHALRRTLDTLKNAWGKSAAAFNGDVLAGMGLVQLRYNGSLDQPGLASAMAPFKGGPAGLLGTARALKEVTGRSVRHSVASIIVETYNKRRRTGKLDPWEAA
jgi:hypothetical protein